MRRGFTLLELLIALAVLAIVSMAVFGSGGDTARQQHRMERSTLARWVAENEVAQMRLELWRKGKKERERVYTARSDPAPSADGRDDLYDAPAQMSLGSRRHRVKLGDRTWQVVRDVQPAAHPDMRRVEVTVYTVEQGLQVGPVDTLTAFVGRR